MTKLTYKAKAWDETFPEVTKTQYLVMSFLLSWQDSGGQTPTEVGLRVLEKPYEKAAVAGRQVIEVLKTKGYAEKVPQAPDDRPFSNNQKRAVKWRLTLHGCLYLKN